MDKKCGMFFFWIPYFFLLTAPRGFMTETLFQLQNVWSTEKKSVLILLIVHSHSSFHPFILPSFPYRGWIKKLFPNCSHTYSFQNKIYKLTRHVLCNIFNTSITPFLAFIHPLFFFSFTSAFKLKLQMFS